MPVRNATRIELDAYQFAVTANLVHQRSDYDIDGSKIFNNVHETSKHYEPNMPSRLSRQPS